MSVDVSDYADNAVVNQWAFAEPQVCEISIPNSRNVLVTYSGTAVATVLGQPSGWRRAIAEFSIPTGNRKWTSLRDRGAGWTLVKSNAPNSAIPNSASVASLAAIYNNQTAVNGGWAVDAAWTEMRLELSEPTGGPIDHLLLRALVAVSDIDGAIYRIAYQVTLVGEIL